MPLLNILDWGVHLPVSVQKILYCTGHIAGGYKKDAGFFREFIWSDEWPWFREETFLSTYDKWIQCVQKFKKISRVVYPMLSCIVWEEHTFHNVFKWWKYIQKITKLCREDKVCWNSVKTEIWLVNISKFPFILISPLSVPPYIGSLPPLGKMHALLWKI